MDAEVQQAFDDEQGRADSPRIAKRLQSEGRKASRNTVASIMKTGGLRAKAAKKFKVTANSNRSLPEPPIGRDRTSMPPRPTKNWVSDITYVWTDEGWLYLAVVLDLFSRRGLALGHGGEDDRRCSPMR